MKDTYVGVCVERSRPAGVRTELYNVDLFIWWKPAVATV